MREEKKKFIDEKYCKLVESLYNKKTKLNIDYKKEVEKYRKLSNLKNMDFFYEVISNPEKFKKINKKPLVGYFCTLVPEELIIASGGVPIRLCNEDIHCAEIGEEIISGDICPLIKAICGNMLQTDLNNI
ncbi:MAG: hypothetical protein N2589_01705, partial [bacterium]|nr:hypothetical protein [bacterium]